MLFGELLDIKQKIEVSKDNDNRYFVSSVQEIKNKRLFIDVPYLSRRALVLSPGDRVQVRFLKGDGYYRFESRVISYHRGEVPAYELSVPEDWDFIQRRGLFRLKLTIEIRCLRERKTGEGQEKFRVVNVKTVDISGGGVRVFSEEAFSLGEKFKVKINLPGEDLGEIDAKVVWIRKELRDHIPVYYAGLEFVGINRKCQDRLIRFLFKKQSQRRHLKQ